MKAEHRKELHTNLLADQLGKLVTRTKSSPKTIWYIVGGLVLLGVVYWWWTTRAANRITVAWIDYWQNREAQAGPLGLLNEQPLNIDNINKGTTAARAARLTLADELYEKGIQSFLPRARDKGNLSSLDEAEKLYQEVADHAGNSTDLALRATLGLGKCEEARGDLQQAIGYYQQVLDRFDKPTRAADGNVKHPLVAEAEKRKDRLAAGDDAAFYKGWPSRLPKSEPSPPPSKSETAPPGK